MREQLNGRENSAHKEISELGDMAQGCLAMKGTFDHRGEQVISADRAERVAGRWSCSTHSRSECQSAELSFTEPVRRSRSRALRYLPSGVGFIPAGRTAATAVIVSRPRPGWLGWPLAGAVSMSVFASRTLLAEQSVAS